MRYIEETWESAWENSQSRKERLPCSMLYEQSKKPLDTATTESFHFILKQSQKNLPTSHEISLSGWQSTVRDFVEFSSYSWMSLRGANLSHLFSHWYYHQ